MLALRYTFQAPSHLTEQLFKGHVPRLSTPVVALVGEIVRLINSLEGVVSYGIKSQSTFRFRASGVRHSLCRRQRDRQQLYDCLFLPEAAGLAHGASALFEVKDNNGTTCIMASFSASFLTTYETGDGSKVGDTSIVRF